MVELREYQAQAIEQLRTAYREGARAPLYVAPTGSGKTVFFAAVVQGAYQRGKRVWVLAHRAELIDQITTALSAFDIPHGFITADRPTSGHAIKVASVQTLVRRLSRHPPPDLLICDEAHHCTDSNSWGQILQHCKDARLLGVTATPIRLDGHGLGTTFDRLIVGPTVAELTAQGYLVPLRVFAPSQVNTEQLRRRYGEFVRGELSDLIDKPAITGDVVAHYRKYAHDRRAIVFAVSVEHARHLADSFRADGVPACCLDGSLDGDVRRDYVRRFKDGGIRVLTSCDLVSEGFDLPAIEVGISVRPTASRGLWLQQVGRCLRPAAGKTHALILDHAGNSLRHGLPTDAITWSLETGVAAQSKTPVGVRVCTHCFAASTARARECVNCGRAFPVEPRTVSQRKGELTEMSAEEYQAHVERRAARQAQGRASTLEELQRIERARGYKAGWAQHVFNAKQLKRQGQHHGHSEDEQAAPT